MADEERIREKLRKIEALFAGATTTGERVAAAAAIDRIKERLKSAQKAESSIEMKFSLGDRWSRQLFLALCRRYGLKPYRYKRQRHTTVMLRTPKRFAEEVLWPEFNELNVVLVEYLEGVTERIIREEVHRDTAEAEEVSPPLSLN